MNFSDSQCIFLNEIWFQNMAQAHKRIYRQILRHKSLHKLCRPFLALIGASLRTAERDGINAVINFNVVHPVEISY